MSTKNGHITRYSDSSIYDEICINCGANDQLGSDALDKKCPKPIEKGGITLQEYWKKDKARIQRIKKREGK